MRNRLKIAIAGLVIVLVGFVYLNWQINSAVEKHCEKVMQYYPELSQNEALLKAVASEELSFEQRNRIVWTVGRLEIEKALPLLKSFYDENECDHSKRLCQKELKKAIKRCD
jgi:hypothetical protein